MNHTTLTIQTHLEGQWHDAADLTLLDVHQGRRSPTRLHYKDTYINQQVANFGTCAEHAISVRCPLTLEVWHHTTWPAWVFDIVLAGLHRDVWEFPRIYLKQLPETLTAWGLA